MNKTLTKRIILSIACLVLAAVIVVANVVINYYSLILNRFIRGDNVDTSTSATTEELLQNADETIRVAAEESMVLLENKNDFLPLATLDKVNLFGWGSTDNGFLLTGGGSGGTNIIDAKEEKLDLSEAFTECGIEYNKTLSDAYVKFSDYDADYRNGGSTNANAVDSLKNPPESFYTDALMNQAKDFSSVAVAVISRWGAENGGSGELKNIGKYKNGSFLEITAEEKAMFDKLEEFNFDVIVVLNVCNNIELGFVKDYDCVKACIFAGIPGQSGTIAIPEIIKGTVNPSGRTSDVLPYDYQTNNPSYINAVKNGTHIVYQEDIYYGYKWYETADAEGVFDDITNDYGTGYDAVVAYPFGYGLSYTKFEKTVKFPKDTTLEKGEEYQVEVTVKNVGEAAGREVVQLYGHTEYAEGGIEKSERVLLDFAKTDVLQPNATETVILTFTAYDLASYDCYDANENDFCGYELEAGIVTVDVMDNSHDKVANGSKSFASPGIEFDKDPETDTTVENLFTGENAYANCPIDGSKAYGTSFSYLSRSGKFENFNALKSIGNPTNSSIVSSAASYRYDGYDDEDTSFVEYSQDAQLYLVRNTLTDGEGNETYQKATLNQLNGNDESAVFTFNTELLEQLVDYDSIFWDTFLNQMSEQEIKDLIGQGGFQTYAIESLGKLRCTDKDGPAGFNNNVSSPNDVCVYPLMPSESLLGCSFDRKVTKSLGEMQGKIGTEYGINGWYGPGVNLHRSVYNSRNYECFSEDGVLSGKLAAAMIDGAAENGVYCYLKHLVLSEPGENPKDLNTWLTEQNLRENYLKAFETALKNSEGCGVMSAFNRVGATLSGYNHALLTNVLREEWGFRGSVITDWYTGSGYMSNHELGVLAGNDLWLCGSTSQAAKLDFSKPGVEYAARQSAKNILYTYVKTYVTATRAKVNAEKTAPLFIALWVALNVILVAGLAVCALFLVKTFKKNPAEEVLITND